MRRRAKRQPRSARSRVLRPVSVGAQPDDRAYLRSIARSADGCGVTVRPVDLPPDCTADALTGTLRALSADDTVHGVLLLRPLPKRCAHSICSTRSHHARMSTA